MSIKRNVFLLSLFIAHTQCDRSKRFLLFPQGNPTRHQLVAGFGVPIQGIEESLVVGYVFKAQYFLPYNVTQLKSSWTRDKRELKEIYDVEPKILSNVELADDDINSTSEESKIIDNTDQIRMKIYRVLEILLNERKFSGRDCVLRTICEINQNPFEIQSGLAAELIHILFT